MSDRMVKSRRDKWFDGIMGVIVGDALGCPVQFMGREEIAGRPQGPVTGMEGHGTFDLPAGSWTDDSSLTLALLDSIRVTDGIDLVDIMDRYARWLQDGEYTPFGYAYDIGRATMASITRYIRDKDVRTCGGTTARDNGNGSLMRILPACLYCRDRQQDGMTDVEAVRLIHAVGGLTHNHLRAKIACGLYSFMVRSILGGAGTLQKGLDAGTLSERLQKGLDEGFAFYEQRVENRAELAYYGRLRDLRAFAQVPAAEIRSSGYVVDTIEAAVWSLITTADYASCELRAVNLGEDTDTVAAVAGGLAGLFYGYGAIPADWLSALQRRDWVEHMAAGE